MFKRHISSVSGKQSPYNSNKIDEKYKDIITQEVIPKYLKELGVQEIFVIQKPSQNKHVFKVLKNKVGIYSFIQLKILDF
jgi:hypothetical protein